MLRKLLPHVAIVLSGMYVVFFLIDRVNSAMAFINNDITKGLLLVLSAVSILNASILIGNERSSIRRQEARNEAARRHMEEQRRKRPSEDAGYRYSNRWR